MQGYTYRGAGSSGTARADPLPAGYHALPPGTLAPSELPQSPNAVSCVSVVEPAAPLPMQNALRIAKQDEEQETFRPLSSIVSFRRTFLVLGLWPSLH
jgi:hypothetical protein